ncbi:MAG: adenylate/guanylate cyclase domain-containing protein [Alphaproteobacteria bacterium]|nr:adenylate/guanylate cyclase domain-containing protein [Alphaproteobacteria bacterium]
MTSGAQWRTKLLWATVVAVLAFAGVVGMRETGALNGLERGVYDALVTWRAQRAPGPAPAVGVVAITDADLARYGDPIPDGILAEAIEKLLKSACCVAIDLYRTKPVEPGGQKLDALLRGTHRASGVAKVEPDGTVAQTPPAALAESGEFGTAFIPLDPDGITRRGLLFMSAGGRSWPGFALMAALDYLAGHGIAPQAEPADLTLGQAVFERLDEDFGGYEDADAGGYQLLLDFRTPPEAFASIGLGQLLDGSVSAELLAGKLVFIGTESGVVKDNFQTPLTGDQDGRPTTGVRVHAQAAGQIIRAALGQSTLPWAWPDAAELTALAALAAGGASIGLTLPAIWAVAVLVLGVALLGAAIGFGFLHGLWLPGAGFIVIWILSVGLATAVVAGLEQRWRRQVAALFTAQLSPRLFEMIWHERDTFLAGGRPKPLRLAVTVMFVDLKGSTSIAAAMPPDAFMAWVGRFLDRMAAVAAEHDAFIEKFTGDGVMLVFGAPLPRTAEHEIEQDAGQAAACALAMRDALNALNQKLAPGEPPIQGRIGIASGDVVGGTVGARQRLQYTIVGNPANTAARLEGVDTDLAPFLPQERGLRILCEERAARLIRAAGSNLALQFTGTAALKGLDGETRLYRIFEPGVVTRDQAVAEAG